MATKIKKILTPLRYPGGKSRAITFLDQYLVKDFDEYREPFVGGGSIFLYLKQLNPTAKYWINDIYYNLYVFWRVLRDKPKELHDFIYRARRDNNTTRCSSLFSVAKNFLHHKYVKISDVKRAGYFYILNKCSYSGLTETGTFSPQASQHNFTFSSIEKLLSISPMLQDVVITNLDYIDLLTKQNDNKVFLYLDPPYDILTKNQNNALYGPKGQLHKDFDHERFHQEMTKCPHKWCITYNYSDVLLQRWQKYRLIEWKLKYGMQWQKDQSGRNKAREKSELLILNY